MHTPLAYALLGARTMPSPTSILHALTHLLRDAVAWTASLCLALLETPRLDTCDDLALYGDAGAYRRDLPPTWR